MTITALPSTSAIWLRLPVWMGLILSITASLAYADQSLETETALPLVPQTFELGVAIEHMRSSEGNETVTPVVVRYGLTPTTKVLVEIVPYVRIAASGSSTVSGFGDSEVAVTQQICGPDGYRPAFAIAGEVKIPTGKKPDIGNGEWDYSGTLIATEVVGGLTLSANVGYTVLGEPRGEQLKNTVNFALGGRYALTDRLDILGEGIYVTSSQTNSSQEGGGVEASITGGVLYHCTKDADYHLEFLYDNNDDALVRTGLNLRF